MGDYVSESSLEVLPRLPLEGTLDVTYRCNNRCRHCWLSIPLDSPQQRQELSLGEIRHLVDDARAMGCRRWCIFGGEPMIRADFPEIFDYITSRSASYTLNTNGSLITPEIAQLMRRPGVKLVAIYGADAQVHDDVTRNPGSFEAAMRGVRCLQEAGAGFIIQIVPMKANVHHYSKMVALAESLSRQWRIGASWLWLSGSGGEKRNQEIRAQRIEPAALLDLTTPAEWYDDVAQEDDIRGCGRNAESDRLFAGCVEAGRSFHVDPYGRMSFCNYIHDDAVRYDLRAGTFKECWEVFIPSLTERITGGVEYAENCGSCEHRRDCYWCPAQGFLEHRRFSAKVEYLCDVARELARRNEEMRRNNRRHYQIGGVTIRVEADRPIRDETFDPKIRAFEVNEPGDDVVTLRLFSSLPERARELGGELVHRREPWAIYRKAGSWIYRSPADEQVPVWLVALFSEDHTRGAIFNDGSTRFDDGGLQSLTTMPTDQIFLARVFADRNGCFVHASGAILNGRGFVFAGESGAGKSTMMKMLREHGEVLCDDRVIVRKWPDGFRVHGTWSHGELPWVSPNSAPLSAILFLEKSADNRLERIADAEDMLARLLPRIIKPVQSASWWDKILRLMEDVIATAPCYVLHFDESGDAVRLLREM